MYLFKQIFKQPSTVASFWKFGSWLNAMRLATSRSRRRNPHSMNTLVQLRQRVLVGIVADSYPLYGRGRVRKLDR